MNAPVLADVSVLAVPPSSSFRFMYLESAETNRLGLGERFPGSFGFNGYYSYLSDPLMETHPDGTQTPVIHSVHSFDFIPNVLLTKDLFLGFHFSLNSIRPQGEEETTRLGDSRLILKYRTSSDESQWKLATSFETLLPTGSEKYHLSTGGIGWALKEALERRWGIFRAALNLGFRYQPKAIWREIDYRRQIYLGAGTEIALSDKISLNAEAVGYLSAPYREKNSPGEYYLGGLYAFSEAAAISAGASLGGAPGENSSVRGLVGLQFYTASAPSATRPSACRPRTFTATYPSRIVEADELANVGELPYRSEIGVRSHSRLVHVKNLRLGEMTGMTPAGLPYVVDSQIPFAIDIPGLPPRSSVKGVARALLKMTVKKVAADPFLGTEILCFVEQKTCSGEIIQRPNWEKAVRWDYFDEDQSSANPYFSRQYLGKTVGKWKENRLYSAELSLDLSELLAGSGVDPLDVLYPDSGRKSIYIVVADDTFVSNDARLQLTLNVEDCE